MRIENLVRLVEGKLHTSPAVSTTRGIAFNPQNIKQGDIFVCEDRLEGSLEIAIEKGAFALIVDKPFTITDREIAWIEVDNLDMAMARLARFFIAKHKLCAYYVSPLELALAKSMNPSKSILLLENTLTPLVKALFQGNLPTSILSSNTLFLKRISPQYLPLPSPPKPALVLPVSTLFQSSFIFEEKLYQNLPLPPFWITSFIKLASLFAPFDWRFSSLKPFEHFVPIFVDKRLAIHPFGTTGQALVIESDVDLFQMQVRYLKTNYPKISICVCAPSKMSLDMKIDFAYEDVEDLLNLNPQIFRYACILGDSTTIESLLQDIKHFKQPTLF